MTRWRIANSNDGDRQRRVRLSYARRSYERGVLRRMTSRRASDPPTLILIDVQRAFDAAEWGPRNNPEAEERVADLLAAWRTAGAPIVHVRHTSRSPDGLFRRGTSAHDFKSEATPLPDEPCVDKSVHSAFIGTELEQMLRDAGARDLVIAGLTTDHCCSTTVRHASELGFGAAIVSDATATFDRLGLAAELVHEVALASLAGEFADVVTTTEAITRLCSGDAG